MWCDTAPQGNRKKYTGRRGRDQQGHATAVCWRIVNQGTIPTCENILAEGLAQLGTAGMDGAAGEEPLRRSKSIWIQDLFCLLFVYFTR